MWGTTVNEVGGEPERAIVLQQRALELDPNFSRAHRELALLYARSGLAEKADDEFKKFLSLSGDNPLWTALHAVVLAWTRRSEEARAILEKLTQHSAREYMHPQAMAKLCLSLEEIDRAFEWLEKAYEEHGQLAHIRGPTWDPLHGDPRCADLLKRIGLDRSH